LLKARQGQSVDLQRTEMTTQNIEINSVTEMLHLQKAIIAILCSGGVQLEGLDSK